MKKLFMFGVVLTVVFITFFACNVVNDQKEFTITFDADGGEIPDNYVSVIKVKVESGKTIENLPYPVPQVTGIHFDGWYTQKNGAGDLFDSSTIVTSNMTVFANWGTHDCDGGNPFENDFHFDEETFMLNWNAWNDRNIKNYSFVLRYTFPGIHVKIKYKDGLIDSFECLNPYCNDTSNFEHLISLNPLEYPDFTSMTHLYQSVYNHVQREKQFGKFSDNIISRTVKLEYGEMNNLTYYFISTKFKPEYVPPLDGDFPYVMSDFKIIEYGTE